MNLTLCLGCGCTIHDGDFPYRYETCLDCKREPSLSESLSCESEAVLHAENIRESLTKPGAHRGALRLMETKIIEFQDQKYTCRRLVKGEIIREGDLFFDGFNEVHDTPDWMSGAVFDLKRYRPHFRPLSPKKAKGKAKGKAKEVESVKPVKVWGVSMDGEIIPSSCRNARIDSKDFNVGLGGKVIRVEIRPLVTRKKGK